MDKAAIEAWLEPKTRRYYDRLLRCGSFGQICWKGSHFARMEKLVEELMA